MTQDQHPVDRCMEIFIYAPIGVAMFAKDAMPTVLKMFVSRGHTVIDDRRKHAQQQAGRYKAVGQLAVKYGSPVVKREAEARVGEAFRIAEDTFNGLTSARDRSGTNFVTRETVPNAVDDQTDTRIDVSSLAIPDYNTLAASQVVERLQGLDPEELAAISEYESKHRARNTILAKISQLTV